MITSSQPNIAYSALNTFFNYITNLPIALSNQEECFPSSDGSTSPCEAFDYLPNIIRCVIPSVKKACSSTVLDIANLSLAILNTVLNGGFIYGADYCEIGVKHMSCPHRTVDFFIISKRIDSQTRRIVHNENHFPLPFRSSHSIGQLRCVDRSCSIHSPTISSIEQKGRIPVSPLFGSLCVLRVSNRLEVCRRCGWSACGVSLWEQSKPVYNASSSGRKAGSDPQWSRREKAGLALWTSSHSTATFTMFAESKAVWIAEMHRSEQTSSDNNNVYYR